jgi:hypothetical protein
MKNFILKNNILIRNFTRNLLYLQIAETGPIEMILQSQSASSLFSLK